MRDRSGCLQQHAPSFGLEKLGLQAADPELRPQAGEHLPGIVGLGDVVVGAALEARDDVSRARLPRDE